jgi:predicted metal-dependent enzyme (double-stranded beta helix superfamily)
MMNYARFRHFVAAFTGLVTEAAGDEERILDRGGRLLSELVAHDDWLPDECARPHPEYYQQYLLHCDPLERFSVVSFVWGPGQKTPVHDHTVWGLVGMMRGAETCRPWRREAGALTAGAQRTLLPGQVEKLSPRIGDVHEVANALADRASISIHVYGANIGAVMRHVFDAKTGQEKPFVSGYSSASLPNFWDRSQDVRAGLARAG